MTPCDVVMWSGAFTCAALSVAIALPSLAVAVFLVVQLGRDS